MAVYDTGLDQFGLASRVVSPHQVQSRYNFLRGGDYRRAAHLRPRARRRRPSPPSPRPRSRTRRRRPATCAQAATRDEWWLRYGWNRPGDAPPLLAAPVTRIRKVEFADAKDLKEWMWKATDGIAETTWPGVYNRSRLPGRNDYFQLPDWNVYVEGGKQLTLTLPNEPWNHLEIQGAAYGDLTYAPRRRGRRDQAGRPAPKGQERTFNQFDGRSHRRRPDLHQHRPGDPDPGDRGL